MKRPVKTEKKGEQGRAKRWDDLCRSCRLWAQTQAPATERRLRTEGQEDRTEEGSQCCFAAPAREKGKGGTEEKGASFDSLVQTSGPRPRPVVESLYL